MMNVAKLKVKLAAANQVWLDASAAVGVACGLHPCDSAPTLDFNIVTSQQTPHSAHNPPGHDSSSLDEVHYSLMVSRLIRRKQS